MIDHGTYKVAGMTCGGCTSSLQKALSEALGAAVEVVVTLEGGRVEVRGAHDPAQVGDVVEGAGFDFEGALAG